MTDYTAIHVLILIAIFLLEIWIFTLMLDVVHLPRKIQETDTKNWLDTIALVHRATGYKPLDEGPPEALRVFRPRPEPR